MIRTALVGYGLGGASFHAPIIEATQGLRLACIVTRDAERRAAAMARHPRAAILDRPEQLWESRDAVDLVVVTTSNRTHVPLAMAALEAGFPVVVDKPIATTWADGQRLVDEACRRGLFLSVYQNRRWDGDFRTVQRLVAEARLGNVFRFESRFERWRPVARPGWRELADPAEGGGLLFDLGTHLIDQALVLFGAVTHVYAELDRRRANASVDDDVFVALTHASGVRSHLHIGVHALDRGPRFRLLGDGATYTKFGMDVQEDALRRGDTPGGADWGNEPESSWGTLTTPADSRRIPTEPGSYPSFYRGVVASLQRSAAPPVDPRDALATLWVIEEARRSGSLSARLVERSVQFDQPGGTGD